MTMVEVQSSRILRTFNLVVRNCVTQKIAPKRTTTDVFFTFSSLLHLVLQYKLQPAELLSAIINLDLRITLFE
jgi:hypothetical protein